MPARHRSRQHALQILFQWDMRKESIWEAVDAFYDTLHSEDEDVKRMERDEFMEQLVRGVADHAASLDARITAKSVNWRIERMAAVDRNILRLAIFEMAELKTPPAIAIDEALELARQFSGEDSASFINGVLDAVRRDLD